jgi:pyruvate dehydrogenase E2 component (dihydrolipoamide acetyltransferase)
MPALFESMTEGDLVTWLVAEGDKVQAGEVIAEIETEKSTLEIEAPETGTLARILVPEGSQGIVVGQSLAILLREGESPENAEMDDGAELSAETEIRAPREAEDLKRTIRVSPLARLMAVQAGLPLDRIHGSGPEGRIMRVDVERALGGVRRPAVATRTRRNADTAAPFVDEALSRTRQTIAQRLSAAKQEIPHFYLNVDCDFEALLDLRADLNRRGGVCKLSVNDFVIKAAARALRDVPAANACFTGKNIRLYQRVDVSLAVATKNGLVTPVLHAANQKSLAEISCEARELAARARAGRLRPEEYGGGSFTISNLGGHGIDGLFAIINAPQTAILGVGRAVKRPIVRCDQVVAAPVATLSLSVDHRVIDGAVGAELLSSIKGYLEDPLGLLWEPRPRRDDR